MLAELDPSRTSSTSFGHGRFVVAVTKGAGELRLHFGFGVGQEPEQRFGGIAAPQFDQSQPGRRLFLAAGGSGGDREERDH